MTAMTKKHGFPRTVRLRRQRDFARVFARRCSAGDARLVVYVDANGLAASRLGLSVSRRVGGAVVRNRAKRLIREAFRLDRRELPSGLDIICVARAAPLPSLSEYRESLSQLIAIAERRLARRTRSEQSDTE